MPPSSGSPLQLSPASDCFDAKVLKAQFGDECKVNEAEAAGTSDMSGGSDDITLGNHPTQGDVHWFCDRRTVVRVVLDRCEPPQAALFRVRQIALSVVKK